MAKKRVKKTTRKRTGSRTQVKRSLKPNEFIVYRGRRGIRKPRGDLLLLAEVRDKKTKRLIGYKNKFKKGKPILQRFSSKQRAVMEMKTVSDYMDFDFDRDLSFTLYSSERLDLQIDRNDDLYRGVMEKIDFEGDTILEMTLESSREQPNRALGIYFDRKWSKELFTTTVTRNILTALDGMAIRMSPKKFAKRKRETKITRALYVRVGFRKP